MNNNEKRLDDSIKLALAMNDIDDALIDEARRPAQIFFTLKNTCVLAASLLLVIVVTIASALIIPAFMPAKDEGPSGGSDKSDVNSAVLLGVGESATLDGANVTLVDKTDGKFTFLINLDKDIEKLDLFIYGIKMEFINNLPNKMKQVVATTSENAPEGYEKVTMPEITVDGNAATALPTTKGMHVVTVDTAALKDAGYVLQSIWLSYFDVGFKYN